MRGMLAIALLLVGCSSPAGQPDAGADAGAWPDLAGPACKGECVECEPISGPGTCAAGATEDDVPAGRDPWPGLCKPRLFGDAFVNYLNWKNSSYDGDRPKFGSSLVGVDHDHCGLLHISPPSPNYTVMTDLRGTADESTLHSSLIDSTRPGYLIEARFASPGTPSGTYLWADIEWPDGLSEEEKGEWNVTARRCSLLRNATPPDQLAVAITRRVAADGGTTEEQLGGEQVAVPDLPGGSLTLQSYVIDEGGQAVLTCRLVQGGWKVEVKTPMLPMTGTGNARLGFSNNSELDKDPVWGLRLFVDWVRAYDSPR